MIRSLRVVPSRAKVIALCNQGSSSRILTSKGNFSTLHPLSSAKTNDAHQTFKKKQQTEKSEEYEDEYRRKMGNNYSMLIASTVGIIGSSYILFQRFSKVEAKELLEGDESLLEHDISSQKDHNSSSVGNHTEMTLHKSQAGFRERKV